MSSENGKVKVISNLDEYQNYLKSPYLVIDFTATWCGPCRMISPIFDQLAEKYSSDDLIFAKVDVDDAQDVSTHCSIRAMPTIVAYKNGEKMEEIVGADPTKLTRMVESLK